MRITAGRSRSSSRPVRDTWVAAVFGLFGVDPHPDHAFHAKRACQPQLRCLTLLGGMRAEAEPRIATGNAMPDRFGFGVVKSAASAS